jgi:hypothetical protein
MTFSIKADNFAVLSFNGAAVVPQQNAGYPYPASWIEGSANELNADLVFSQNLRAGENTITLHVGDYGGKNGFNFRVDLSADSDQPLAIVPPGTPSAPPPPVPPSTAAITDTTPPVIDSVTPSTATLWPPNRQMVPVSVTVNATDNVGVVSKKITVVSSSELDDGPGDGNTAGDVQITGDLTVNLRAKLSGKGNGRTYTVYVEVKDAAGNTTMESCTVSVPKSQGGK